MPRDRDQLLAEIRDLRRDLFTLQGALGPFVRSAAGRRAEFRALAQAYVKVYRINHTEVPHDPDDDDSAVARTDA